MEDASNLENYESNIDSNLISRKAEIAKEYQSFVNQFDQQKEKFRKLSKNNVINFDELFNFIDEIFTDCQVYKKNVESESIFLKILIKQHNFIKDIFEYNIEPIRLNKIKNQLEIQDKV